MDRNGDAMFCQDEFAAVDFAKVGDHTRENAQNNTATIVSSRAKHSLKPLTQ